MKASLKFREEQKPIFRAKVPLSIMGLPFQSGIVAGESKELTLNLATFFESGPSIKVAYRPNDTWNPFSLVVRTGTGSFGSPISSSMLMSAEFNLLGRGNPSFMLHFKPQFGDFSMKKSLSSVFDKKIRSLKDAAVVSEDDASIEVEESPVANGSFPARKITVLPSPTAGDIARLFSGVEVAARTDLPVRGRAVLSCRWGVRVPAEMKIGAGVDPKAGFSFRKIPFLMMNKIGIEHVDGEDSKGTTAKACPDAGDVAGACFTVKHQLEILQAENGFLKRAVEDLRQEIATRKSISMTADFNPGNYREIERNGIKPSSGKTDKRNNEKKSTDVSGFGGKSVEGDVNSEVKKSSKGA